MRALPALAVSLLAALTLAGCASAPAPEQAAPGPSAPSAQAPEQKQEASRLSRGLDEAERFAADYGGPVAAIAGGLMMLDDLKMLEPEYLAGGLVAFAIYDPFAPTWRVDVREAGGDRVRMALRMKSLFTGGDGEARQVFLRNARQMVEAGGFAGYEIVHYEEGVESTRPFARRYANAEIQLLRSRIFPAL